jgi:hypothetical protein
MKIKESYPFDFSFIANHTAEAEMVIKKIKPHKGGFVGLEILEGSFPDGNAQELFEEMSFGERFELFRDKEDKTITPLEVKREDGATIGYLSFPISVLLASLIEREIKCFCFLEAKEESSGIYSVAVSVYCEQY